LRHFATGKIESANPLTESALAKRAYDAVRELRYLTESQIGKVAGLTNSELKLALTELLAANLVIEDHSSGEMVHYALKYAH
jgi:hypothetical protein